MDSATQRKLRRLVLAERYHDARTMLKQYLESSCGDKEAEAEWQRLNNGQPMVLSLPAAERRRHAVGTALNRLNVLMVKYPPNKVKYLPAAELKGILKTATEQQSIIKGNASALPPDIREYINTIKSRISQFNSRSVRFYLKYSIIGLSCIAIATGIWTGLRHAAYSAREALQAAMQSPLYDNVAERVRAADRPLNHYFCPEISTSIQHAELWLRHQDEEFAALNQQLTRLENGAVKFSFLSSSEILELEERVERIQRGRTPLQKRWQAICQAEYHALEAKKKEVLKELTTALPPFPTWAGDVEEDIRHLTEHKVAMLHLLLKTQAIVKFYQVSTDIVQEITARINHTEKILRELHQLRITLKSIASARSYSAYCDRMQQLRVNYYTPAHPLMEIAQRLPNLDAVAHHMVVSKGKYSREMLAAALDIFVNKLPSFPSAFPANNTLFRIAEDILTAPSLQNKVYTLKLSEDETWYSTIEPELDDTNFITYRRSSIDPRFTPDNNFREFQNDNTYQLDVIDATRLLPDLGIERNSLFVAGNLPSLLSATLNYKAGKQPALAQACVYLTLLKLTDAHPHPFLSGVRFSPTLREHAVSFNALLKRHHKITLRPGCWLSTAPEVKRAEKAFAEWFRTHRGVQYQEEMAKAFVSAYCATPQFCGYVNEHGELQLFDGNHEPEPLWYVDKDGIKCANSPENMPAALPLSPIFKKKHP